jgi:hypothetical protein
MYVYILETRRGFFEVVCAPCKASAYLSAPPPPIRELNTSASRDKYERGQRDTICPVNSIGIREKLAHMLIYVACRRQGKSNAGVLPK